MLDSNVKSGGFDLKDSNHECIDKLIVSENIDSDFFIFKRFMRLHVLLASLMSVLIRKSLALPLKR